MKSKGKKKIIEETKGEITLTELREERNSKFMFGKIKSKYIIIEVMRYAKDEIYEANKFFSQINKSMKILVVQNMELINIIFQNKVIFEIIDINPKSIYIRNWNNCRLRFNCLDFSDCDEYLDVFVNFFIPLIKERSKIVFH